MPKPLKVGARVRAKDINKVGGPFRGLVGTVVGTEFDGYQINFDTPPRDASLDWQGGVWSRETLALISPIQEAKVALREAAAEIDSHTALIGELRRRVSELTTELEVEQRKSDSFRDSANEAWKVVNGIENVLDYAKGLLPESARAQVQGYIDGRASRA